MYFLRKDIIERYGKTIEGTSGRVRPCLPMQKERSRIYTRVSAGEENEEYCSGCLPFCSGKTIQGWWTIFLVKFNKPFQLAGYTEGGWAVFLQSHSKWNLKILGCGITKKMVLSPGDEVWIIGKSTFGDEKSFLKRQEVTETEHGGDVFGMF